MMRPAVGKSGPLTIFISRAIVIFGSSAIATTASMISPRLCGGTFVAMPTAMPDEPLTSRFGKREGRTIGSLSYPSKFGTKSTVSLPMSRNISMARGASRASVYLMAAGGSPSIEPKLPCGSTSGFRIEKSCAIRTSAS